MLAALLIILEHLREAFPKFQRDALSHYTNTVDGVDQGLGFGFEEIADQNFDHGL
jgi:hypothetical protein